MGVTISTHTARHATLRGLSPTRTGASDTTTVVAQKGEVMKRQGILGVFVLAVVAMLAPDAAAQLCFSDQNGNTYRLEVGAFSGQFVTINGGVVSSGLLTSTLSGAGRLRPDGRAQIGFTIHSSDATNFPLVGQVVLNPPGFNSGTGSTDSLSGGFTSLTLTPASCPVLP